MSYEITGVAKATMTVEVTLGSYGSGWTMETVMKQAEDEAKNALINKLKTMSGIRIIGEPVISVITWEKKK